LFIVDKKIDDVENDLRRAMSRTPSTINKAALSRAISEIEQVEEEPESPQKKKHKKEKKQKKEKHHSDKTIVAEEVKEKEELSSALSKEEQKDVVVIPQTESQVEKPKPVVETSVPSAQINGEESEIKEDSVEDQRNAPSTQKPEETENPEVKQSHDKAASREPPSRQMSFVNKHRFQQADNGKKPVDPPKSKSKLCNLM